jgi:hypothetical protein
MVFDIPRDADRTGVEVGFLGTVTRAAALEASVAGNHLPQLLNSWKTNSAMKLKPQPHKLGFLFLPQGNNSLIGENAILKVDVRKILFGQKEDVGLLGVSDWTRLIICCHRLFARHLEKKFLWSAQNDVLKYSATPKPYLFRMFGIHQTSVFKLLIRENICSRKVYCTGFVKRSQGPVKLLPD